ncbi:MAG TPA: hypothetical protein VI197_27900, partial [Polyangiaceae bacterium]
MSDSKDLSRRRLLTYGASGTLATALGFEAAPSQAAPSQAAPSQAAPSQAAPSQVPRRVLGKTGQS